MLDNVGIALKPVNNLQMQTNLLVSVKNEFSPKIDFDILSNVQICSTSYYTLKEIDKSLN